VKLWYNIYYNGKSVSSRTAQICTSVHIGTWRQSAFFGRKKTPDKAGV